MSQITVPHQPYAPLLERAGQMDISVRGGWISTNVSTLAVQAAYAPIDHLTIAVSLDGDLYRNERDPTFHAGGGIAVGTFSRTDVLRLEAFAGLSVGYAEGYGEQALWDEDLPPAENFALSGTYVQPFVQVAVGFEIPYFELAGGLRLEAQFTDVSATGDLGTRTSVMHERVLLGPFLTVRVPVDVLRFEVMTGVPVAANGHEGPLPNTNEYPLYWYIVGGIGLQFDLFGGADPTEDDPLYAPPPAPSALPPPTGEVR